MCLQILLILSPWCFFIPQIYHLSRLLLFLAWILATSHFPNPSFTLQWEYFFIIARHSYKTEKDIYELKGKNLQDILCFKKPGLELGIDVKFYARKKQSKDIFICIFKKRIKVVIWHKHLEWMFWGRDGNKIIHCIPFWLFYFLWKCECTKFKNY